MEQPLVNGIRIIPFDKLWEMVNSSKGITTASQPFTSALAMSNP